MPAIAAISIFDGSRAGTDDPSRPLPDGLPRIYVAPVLVDDLEQGDPAAFRAHTLRPLRPGVLGCALAHRQAAAALLESGFEWGIVLEDDAQVVDPQSLVRKAEDLAAWADPRSPTLLLFAWGMACPSASGPAGPIEGTTRRSFTPMSTVAYLMNVGTAELIVRRQQPVEFPADWPVLGNEVVILTDDDRSVEHRELPSLVAAKGRDDSLPRFWRLRLLSMVWYLQHRSHFEGIGDYLHMLVLPRLHAASCRVMGRIHGSRGHARKRGVAQPPPPPQATDETDVGGRPQPGLDAKSRP